MLDELRPHIQELRARLLKIILALLLCFIVSFYFWEALLDFIAKPLRQALSDEAEIIAYKMGEQFFVALKVSFFAAFVFALPVIFYQIYAFIAPGLYENEKKHIIPFVLMSYVMFLLGAFFAYYIVFPYGFKYLVNFGQSSVIAMISIGEYLGFFLKLLFGFGLSFELPMLCLFLARLGLITHKSLIGFFKYAILLIFLLAALLTPPDIFTQTLMAAPLIILYAVSIIVVKITNSTN